MYQRICIVIITQHGRKGYVNYDGPRRKMQREVTEQRIEKDAKMNLHSREKDEKRTCKQTDAKSKVL